MSAPPPILLLFDVSALLARTTREWQEFSQMGACCVPKVILEEIQFLCDRAPEPDQEKKAREFMRFYPQSDWQMTEADADHPLLQPPAEEALSKTARLALAVAQCAYGLSQEEPNKLVIFVTNEYKLLQKIRSLAVLNLCPLPESTFVQWVRTQQRPIAVTQKLQLLTRSSSKTAVSQPLTRPPNPANAPTASRSRTTSSSTPAARSSPARNHPAHHPSRPLQRSTFSGRGVGSQLVSGLIALIFVAIASLIWLRMTQPANFNKLWKQMGLPALPSQAPPRK